MPTKQRRKRNTYAIAISALRFEKGGVTNGCQSIVVRGQDSDAVFEGKKILYCGFPRHEGWQNHTICIMRVNS